MNARMLAVLLAGLPSAALAATPAVPTLPPAALHAGEKALVRTVFAGDTVESFDAEIVGVVPGGRAQGDLILARATTPRVRESGIAQGMSGSPVYVDGKLIGALSSGWSFSRDPVFGITPIGDMLAVLDEPESRRTDGTAGPSGADPLDAGEAHVREFRWSDPPPAASGAPALPAAPERGGTPAALPLPLAASGLAPEAYAPLRALFAPSGLEIVPGGRAQASRGGTAGATAPPTLEPGDAVAVDVLRGDLELAAIGTVTYRDGDRVLIFGHPFFQSGEVRLPLSTAHITTIVSSLETSFKIGVAGTPVGVATQDRRAAVAGHLGTPPALLPLAVDVALPGRPPQRFRFGTVEDRALAPQLIGAAVFNSVLESGGQGGAQTIDWTLDVYRGGRRLRVADREAGDVPLADAVGSVTEPIRFLFANPFERLHLDSLHVSLQVAPGRSLVTLRSATLSEPRVERGDTLRVLAEVERWHGARETVRLALPVPEELPPGRYLLHIAGGQEFDRGVAQRLPARFRPVSLDDAWRRLGGLRRSDELYAGLWAHAPDVSEDGEDWPELPASALPLLAPGQSAGARARPADWALVSERALALGAVVRGELQLEVTVDDARR